MYELSYLGEKIFFINFDQKSGVLTKKVDENKSMMVSLKKVEKNANKDNFVKKCFVHQRTKFHFVDFVFVNFRFKWF